MSIFLISNFRHVLNNVCLQLGNSPASEFYMPTFRNTLFHLHRQVCTCLWRWDGQCSETSAHKIQKKAYIIRIIYIIAHLFGVTLVNYVTRSHYAKFISVLLLYCPQFFHVIRSTTISMKVSFSETRETERTAGSICGSNLFLNLSDKNNSTYHIVWNGVLLICRIHNGLAFPSCFHNMKVGYFILCLLLRNIPDAIKWFLGWP